jgi:predicted HAD superfamily Cof-like phosphohydrolase
MALNSKVKEVAPVDALALEQMKSHVYDHHQMFIKQWMTTAEQATPSVPTLADIKTQKLRVRLIAEELTELQDAYDSKNIIDVADAIADLLYVVYGTAVAHGINIKPIFTAVHNNNMEKIIHGHKDEGGKWIKPINHLPPDLESLIVMQWRASPIRAEPRAVTCSKCAVPNIAHRHDAAPFDYLMVLCDGVRVKL